MSIYIKDMEMPKSCYACMFFAQTDYWNKEDEADILSRCKRTGEKTWESVNGYLPHCPLVPVPPHGRLIDADALIAYCKHFASVYKDSQLPTDKVRRDELLSVIGEIVNTPTIIPAEEGET